MVGSPTIRNQSPESLLHMLDGATKTDFDESRPDGTARIIAVCGIAWSMFALHYFYLQRIDCGLNGLLQVIIAAGFALLLKYKPKYSLPIAHLYLASFALGLAYDSFANGLERAMSPMGYAGVVLVAAYAIGRRGTIIWVAVSMTLILLINHVLPELLPARPSSTVADKTIALMVIITMVGFCAYSAESTARTYSQRLERVVGIDALTGLRNRRRFREDMDRLINANASDAQAVALLLIDVNDFKPINDRLGHEVGDRVLQNVGKRLSDSVGEIGTAYRLGGDEFVAVVVASDYESACKRGLNAANTFEAAMKSQNTGTKRTASCPTTTASVGIAVYPDHAESLDELLSCADKAMYESKARAESATLFERRMLDEAIRLMNLKLQLESAIENEEFKLVYQPQVDFDSNKIVGVEALLRWSCGEELITPDVFILCLEETGLIVEVGSWVVQSACEQLWRWRNEGIELRVSVNVSPLQMQDCHFADFVLGTLEDFGLDGQHLDIEITETLFLERNAVTRKNIEQLTQHGVTIAVDDFGTGYSSLAYLKQLPLDRLKIDKSFICDFPATDDGVIAATVITLAKQLGMNVTAEGVETEVQRDFLRGLECDEYQGYLFSKPVLPEAISELFDQHKLMPSARVSVAAGKTLQDQTLSRPTC